MAYYFVTMNLAIAVGFWRFLRNSQRAAWDRTRAGLASGRPAALRAGSSVRVGGEELPGEHLGASAARRAQRDR